MIPLRDVNRTAHYPWVNQLLILANIAVFAYELVLMSQGETVLENFLMDWGCVHSRLVTEHSLHDVATIFTSMFLHGGWGHVIFNMWFLYIFGDNVEDRLGHGAYLFFYFLCGLGAELGNLLTRPFFNMPTIGASGAIAGVLGAYFVMFPGAKIVTFNPFGLFWILVTRRLVIQVPAIFFLGYWLLLQCFSGVASLDVMAQEAEDSGGIAYWAHIGGFVVGLLAFLLPRRDEAAFQRAAADADIMEVPASQLGGGAPAWFWALMICVAVGCSGTIAYKVNTLDRGLVEHPRVSRVAVTRIAPYRELAGAVLNNGRIKAAGSAVSIDLAGDHSIWFVNDTLVGLASKKHRVKLETVANVVSVTAEPTGRTPPRAVAVYGRAKLEPLLQPADKNVSYRILSGAFIQGKIYLFALRVKKTAPASYDGTDLLTITNPEVKPSDWKYTRKQITRGGSARIPGVACFVESHYLYVFEGIPDQKASQTVFRLALCRIPWLDVVRGDLSSLSYFCRHTKSMPGWSADSKDLVELFEYAGPAMSVSHVKGIGGFVAVYAAPDGSRLLLRHSRLPEGRWSEPIVAVLVTDPVKISNVQNHPEMASQELQLAVTYALTMTKAKPGESAEASMGALQFDRVDVGIRQ